VPACQPLDGVAVDVLMAYSTVWLPGLVGIVTALTVMLFAVGVPLMVGAPLTAAPSPLFTALAVIAPVVGIAIVAFVTLDTGILVGSVTVLVLALYTVGVPVTGMVTTVSLVRTAVPAVSPGGRFDTEKSEAVIVLEYVLLDSVNIMLTLLTAWLTFKAVISVDVIVM